MLIVANYKANGNIDFYATIIKKINKVKDTLLVLCPPFVFLPQFKNLKFCKLGTQNVDETNKTTGGITASMLKELNCEYTIVGHSESRTFETDNDICNKVINLQNQNITPIVCVGESDRGRGYNSFKHQVCSVLKVLNKQKPIIFAYEPVYSVSTGVPAEPKHVCNMIKNIKRTTQLFGIEAKVLYGGGINQHNFKDFMGFVDGFMVGNLALNIEDFLAFLRGVYGK